MLRSEACLVPFYGSVQVTVLVGPMVVGTGLVKFGGSLAVTHGKDVVRTIPVASSLSRPFHDFEQKLQKNPNISKKTGFPGQPWKLAGFARMTCPGQEALDVNNRPLVASADSVNGAVFPNSLGFRVFRFFLLSPARDEG